MSTVIDLDHAVRPDLSGRRVVILGGTGSVGEGIVRAWLAAGADVVVPSRTQGRADQFTEVLGDLADAPGLHLVVGDYTEFDAAEAMAARITAELGEVTDVVASIGGWWQGKPLWEVTAEEWNRWFVGLTTAHVAQVARGSRGCPSGAATSSSSADRPSRPCRAPRSSTWSRPRC